MRKIRSVVLGWLAACIAAVTQAPPPQPQTFTWNENPFAKRMYGRFVGGMSKAGGFVTAVAGLARDAVDAFLLATGCVAPGRLRVGDGTGTATVEEKEALDEQKLARLKAAGVDKLIQEMVTDALASAREGRGGGHGNGEAGTGIKRIVAGGQGAPTDGVQPSRGSDFKTRLSRTIMALAIGKNDLRRAASFAREKWGDESVAKALTSADEEGGGFLIQEETSEEIIELLRPMSVVRDLNPVMAPMDSGVLRLPGIATGASGGYVAESSAQNASEPTFRMVNLSAKKYVGIVPISNDLVRRGGPRVEQMVQEDVAGAVAQDSDIEFIRGDGASGTPQGLRNLAADANLLDANATVNLDNVTSDLGLMIQTLGDADVRMLRLGWIMEWRTWRYLITVRDSNGNLVFKPEMDDGTLFGFPFRVTSQIPRNLDASGTSGDDETELYLADFADVVIGETTGLLIDVFEAAAYNDSGGTVVSSLSRDERVVRTIVEHDIALRHDESVVVLEEVTWGV